MIIKKLVIGRMLHCFQDMPSSVTRLVQLGCVQTQLFCRSSVYENIETYQKMG